MKRMLTLLLALLAVVLIGACGETSSRAKAPVPHKASVAAAEPGKPGAVPNSPPDVTQPEWTDWGAKLTGLRAQVNKDTPDQKNSDGSEMVPTFGPYLTQPQDIKGEGPVVLTFGPLTDADVLRSPALPTGSRAPLDSTFRIGLDLNPKTNKSDHVGYDVVKGEDGNYYGKIQMMVTDFKGPYAGFTLWFQ
jgi:hypothetical protein